jgi:hypothetical protein
MLPIPPLQATRIPSCDSKTLRSSFSASRSTTIASTKHTNSRTPNGVPACSHSSLAGPRKTKV